MGQKARVCCDRQCGKAWGINNRPQIQLSEEDEDDTVWLSDGELGDAPSEPGTWEDGYGKPSTPDAFPNKWCVRECERSAMSEPGRFDEPVELPRLDVRLYNQPSKHPEAAESQRKTPVTIADDKRLSFDEVLKAASSNPAFVAQFNRLTGCDFGRSLRRTPIEVMIDQSTGFSGEDADDLALFIAVVYDLLWCRLPPELLNGS
jgi:hypothetical protein